jgi:hypothetical protein
MKIIQLENPNTETDLRNILHEFKLIRQHTNQQIIVPRTVATLSSSQNHTHFFGITMGMLMSTQPSILLR